MKKGVTTLGVLLAIGLIVVGVFLPMPPKEIGMYSFEENGYTSYVGGDAYNIQIEASLRGGQIAGMTAAKTILISCGAILLFLSMAYGSFSEFSEISVQRNDNCQKDRGSFMNNYEIETSVAEWKCQKCGSTNKASQDYCKDCGEYK